jgi:hypothetical protein
LGSMFVRTLRCDMTGSFRLRRHMRRHRRSPTVAKSPVGRDLRAHRACVNTALRMLCLQRKSSPFCREIRAGRPSIVFFLRSEWGR